MSKRAPKQHPDWTPSGESEALHAPPRASAAQRVLPQPPAATLRVKKTPTAASKGKPRRSRKLSAHSELALLWGLLYDLVRAPVFLVMLLLGRAKLRDALQPIHRVSHFILSARATATLIGLNVLCFAVEFVYLRRWPMARFLETFAFSPQVLWQGRVLPIVLHVFSHASLPHLLSNMMALFVFGRVVEKLLGPLRLLLAYGLAAMAATLTSLLAQGLSGQYVPTLGASGAVAGLIALGVLLSPLSISFEALIPMPLFLVGWLAMAGDLLALWMKSSDSVDHPAHLGGYLSVVLVYRLLPSKLKAKARFGLLLNVLTILFALAMWYLTRSGKLAFPALS